MKLERFVSHLGSLLSALCKDTEAKSAASLRSNVTHSINLYKTVLRP